ncbi:serum albumin-like isoform X2 [Hyla sarda]|uniref:serum albumin-like isoform X2 n=1 Tax=Hyla sarda TaxID=327740 RepID=UPI0024C47158|nr:serum albumin-like isoform X2 [Hyla sarda]
MCKHPELAERYPWSVECCAKAEPEREKCFHDHRDIEAEQYQVPDFDVACKEHKENHDHAFNQYIDKISKRHSSIFPPTIVARARQYDTVVTECCEAEDKPTCFRARFAEVVKTTYYIEQKQKHICHIASKFPERVPQAINIAFISQKHPAASFDLVHKFTTEAVHMMKDCCKGDVVECMVEGLEYTQHICDDQEKFFSPNLKVCCEKPLLERTPCIMALPKDDIPADLPKELPKEFVEDEHVCDQFKDHKDPQLLAAGIKESQDLQKQHCDAYEHLGPYGFNIQLLGAYVPKMRQVSDATLLEVTDKMTKFAGKCCALPQNQRLSCAEEKLDLLLGQMCERQATTFINDQVRHCCDDSYADRRPCFTKLGVDPSYQPPAFDESAFKVGADICEGSEQEQKNKRLTLLIHVLKLKPDISKEKMKETVEEFTKAREKCCAAPDHQLCFETERPTFLLHLKELLGH